MKRIFRVVIRFRSVAVGMRQMCIGGQIELVWQLLMTAEWHRPLATCRAASGREERRAKGQGEGNDGRTSPSVDSHQNAPAAAAVPTVKCMNKSVRMSERKNARGQSRSEADDASVHSHHSGPLVLKEMGGELCDAFRRVRIDDAATAAEKRQLRRPIFDFALCLFHARPS